MTMLNGFVLETRYDAGTFVLRLLDRSLSCILLDADLAFHSPFWSGIHGRVFSRQSTLVSVVCYISFPFPMIGLRLGLMLGLVHIASDSGLIVINCGHATVRAKPAVETRTHTFLRMFESIRSSQSRDIHHG